MTQVLVLIMQNATHLSTTANTFALINFGVPFYYPESFKEVAEATMVTGYARLNISHSFNEAGMLAVF